MRKHTKVGMSLALVATIGLAVIPNTSGGATEESASQAATLQLPKGGGLDVEGTRLG